MAGGPVQWSKFQRLLRRNPNEALWIREHIGSPALVCAPLNYPPAIAERMLREHVQAKLVFIAFRDFNTLNLESGNSCEEGAHILPNQQLSASQRALRTSLHINYRVRFQIEGVDEPGGRMVYIDDKDYKSECAKYFTIREAIDSRIAWHQEYWARKGKALRFNAVVKETLFWIQLGVHTWNCIEEKLEIFRFPESYTYPPLSDTQISDDTETVQDRAELMAT